MEELILYKYKALNTYTIDSIAQKYLFFPTARQLNDPFECWTEIDLECTDKQFKEHLKKQGEILNAEICCSLERYKSLMKSEEYQLRRLEDLNSFRVFSLAESCTNDAMWAYYSENYKGLCLGYKAFPIEDGNPKAIYVYRPQIKTCPEIHDDNGCPFLIFQKVKYQDDGKTKLNIITKENREIVADNLYIKKECWKSEREYRSVFYIGENKDNLKIFYPDETLAEVIFGYRMEKENMNTIKYLIDKLYSNKVNFFVAKPDYETMKIIKEPFTSENR
jgi:hypothetical protein